MILVDANLLLYAYDTSNESHDAARRWLEQTLSSGSAVRFALVTLLAFVRIASDRRVFERPLTVEEACNVVTSWLALPAVAMLEPGAHHWEMLSRVAREGQATGPLAMDAHLAVLAMEHGATVATTDRDFARFADLSFQNPLHR